MTEEEALHPKWVKLMWIKVAVDVVHMLRAEENITLMSLEKTFLDEWKFVHARKQTQHSEKGYECR